MGNQRVGSRPDPGLVRVSVVMPTYRQDWHVERSLNSLLAQAFTGWELVIVDDGSPDATPELVRPYLRDPRITYTQQKHNQNHKNTQNKNNQHNKQEKTKKQNKKQKKKRKDKQKQ